MSESIPDALMYTKRLLLSLSILASFLLASAQVAELDWPLEILSEGHGFTEGVSLASDGSLFFSDMDKEKILRFDPHKAETEVWQEESGKTNGLYIRDNKLYGCEAVGRAVVQYDLARGPGSRKVLVSDFQGKKLGCPNDLTLMGDMLYFSEFWIAGFHRETGEQREIFTNRVYAYHLKKHTLDSIKFSFKTPNGVASSPDGKFLFIGDIEANKLYRAKVKKGQVGELEELVDLSKLELVGPDGLAIHRDGRIFLALYRSDKLLVLNPDGSAIGTLTTGSLTSNCYFAADGKTLYITADQKLKRVIVP